MDEIKSGKEILDDFFNTVYEIPGVDSTIAAALKVINNLPVTSAVTSACPKR